MDKTYVFSNEPSSGCCGGSKLDITALLPNLMGGNRLDPNLLLALNNGYRNQDMWGGAGMPLDGEEICYLSGWIAQEMYPILIHYLTRCGLWKIRKTL